MKTMTNRQPRSEALASAHETARGLLKTGMISKATMAQFDTLCLQPVRPLDSDSIKALRTRLEISQPVFAAYLNVSPATVKAWEQGLKTPTGASLKLLNLVETKGLDVVV